MSEFNAGLPQQSNKLLGSTLPIGSSMPMPVVDNNPIKLPDGSLWLQSGNVVPASQSPLLAGNPAFRAIVPSAITTPIDLQNSYYWSFVQGGGVGIYFNPQIFSYIYTTDLGETWLSGTVSGITSSCNFLGMRYTGSGFEILVSYTSNVIFRAVITTATPQTCAFASTGNTPSDSSYLSYGAYVYDTTSSTHYYFWPSTTANTFNSIKSTNGIAWTGSYNITASGSGTPAGSPITACLKPGGGIRIIYHSGNSTSASVWSTTDGSSYAVVGAANNISSGAVPNSYNQRRTVFYAGTRLFYWSGVFSASYLMFSDDNGVTWKSLSTTQCPIFRFSSASYIASVTYDGTRISFYLAYGAFSFFIFSADGNNFSAVPYVYGGDSTNATYGFFYGQKWFLQATANGTNRLYKSANTFTPNSATDYVGIPFAQNLSYYSTPFSSMYYLRIA